MSRAIGTQYHYSANSDHKILILLATKNLS